MDTCVRELATTASSMKVVTCVCVVCMSISYILYWYNIVLYVAMCNLWIYNCYFCFLQPKVDLSSVRSIIVTGEERPRMSLLSSFSHLFSQLGLSTKAVTASFGCRVNPAICLQVILIILMCLPVHCFKMRVLLYNF